jgi:RNA polymerase sigma-70 factor (sigma-E family)
VDLDTARQPRPRGVLDWRADAGPLVTALYQAHGVGLIRLAVVMLGDRPAAEDVVQEAFCGLYRRWDHLDDPGNALRYLRSSVLNGCRSVLRNRGRLYLRLGQEPGRPDSVESAESTALVGEEHRAVLAALRRLPDRQRAALVLRFYLELSEAEIAQAMGISQGTVKSTVSRALGALGRLLGESQ